MRNSLKHPKIGVGWPGNSDTPSVVPDHLPKSKRTIRTRCPPCPSMPVVSTQLCPQLPGSGWRMTMMCGLDPSTRRGSEEDQQSLACLSISVHGSSVGRLTRQRSRKGHVLVILLRIILHTASLHLTLQSGFLPARSFGLGCCFSIILSHRG